ncbi:MAG: GDSL-type esterase/lipase family protein [Desulfovibrio sp.]|nr:GDSL-type esterase/lipase family protein [Desulfovibrio sp.]
MRVIFLGDSLTWRFDWERALNGLSASPPDDGESAYHRQASAQAQSQDILQARNFGVDGDTTGDILHRLERVAAARPDMVFLQAGINDLFSFPFLPDEAALHSLLKRHREIWRRLLKDCPGLRLYICSLLPISHRLDGDGSFNIPIRAFNVLLAEAADAAGLPYVDLYPALGNEKGELAPQYDEDGVHLLPAAYVVWLECIKPFLQSK